MFFIDVDFPAIFLQNLPILFRILSISLLVLHAVVHFQSQLLFVLQIDQIFLQKLAEGAVNCILRGGSLGVLAEVCMVEHGLHIGKNTCRSLMES